MDDLGDGDDNNSEYGRVDVCGACGHPADDHDEDHLANLCAGYTDEPRKPEIKAFRFDAAEPAEVDPGERPDAVVLDRIASVLRANPLDALSRIRNEVLVSGRDAGPP